MGPLLFSVFAFAVSTLASGSSVNDFRRLSRAEFQNLNKICGKSSISNHPRSPVQRVARGSLVKQGEFPWAVLFYEWLNRDGLNLVGRCSGSIISKYHIMTAAHCVIENSTYPGYFSLNIKNSYIIGGSPCANTTLNVEGQPYAVLWNGQGCTQQVNENLRALHIKNIIVPRSSLLSKMERSVQGTEGREGPDIAVLELAEPIPDVDGQLLPICVPSIYTKTPLTYTAYGFGSTEYGENVELLKHPVKADKLLDKNECEITWIYGGRCIDTVGIVLEDEDGSMCVGDSGGTFSGFLDGKEYLFGVLSTSACKHCNGTAPWQNSFTVTRVASYSDFLCFYTGVCPLGYDFYSEWNYAGNPEPVLFFSKEDHKKYFDEGDFVVPIRKGREEQKSFEESSGENEWFDHLD